MQTVDLIQSQKQWRRMTGYQSLLKFEPVFVDLYSPSGVDSACEPWV